MKRFYSFLTLVFLVSIVIAQDVQFTMPYSAPLYINPAFAGSAGYARVAGTYRNQWPNISGSYITTSISADRYVKCIRGGIGISYFNDEHGMRTLTKNSLSVIYSAHIPIFKNKCIISPALEGSYGRNYLDWSKLTFGSPQYGFVYGGNHKEIITYPDFSSGVLIYSQKLFGGFAVHHINEPEEAFLNTNSRLPRKYTAHAGANLNIGDSARAFIVSPSVIYSQQQDFKNLILSCAIQRGVIAGAIAYENGDKIITSIGFRYNIFRMAYSYDITISKLGVVTAGSHEIMLSFLFNKKAKPERFLAFETASF